MVGLLIMLFPEVSMTDLKEPWKEVVSRPWADKEDIFILEGRAGIVCLRRVLRTAKGFHRRHLFIGDSMSAILAFQKGRACHPGLLQLCRHVAALCVAGDVIARWRWVASELNPADEASRKFEGKNGVEAGKGHSRGPEGRCGVAGPGGAPHSAPKGGRRCMARPWLFPRRMTTSGPATQQWLPEPACPPTAVLSHQRQQKARDEPRVARRSPDQQQQ